ncbi:MAG: hypothetical protein D6749_04260 [Chloroflexota bacterium]|nr:MAG: hypothetical protein D6749_04260 [Chloroflexota bacterium]
MLCSIVALSALSGTARALGRERHGDWQAVFTTPEGLPCRPLCLFGVIAAKHTPEQAFELLRRHPLTHNWEPVSATRLESRQKAGTAAVSFSLLADGVLDTITLAFEHAEPDAPESAPIRLGDILSLFGAPDYLHISAQTDPMLVYVSQRLIVSVKLDRTRRLAPELPIKRLTLFRFGICPSSAPLYAFLAWRGLTHDKRQMAGNLIPRYVRRVFAAQVTLVPC